MYKIELTHLIHSLSRESRYLPILPNDVGMNLSRTCICTRLRLEVVPGVRDIDFAVFDESRFGDRRPLSDRYKSMINLARRITRVGIEQLNFSSSSFRFFSFSAGYLPVSLPFFTFFDGVRIRVAREQLTLN